MLCLTLSAEKAHPQPFVLCLTLSAEKAHPQPFDLCLTLSAEKAHPQPFDLCLTLSAEKAHPQPREVRLLHYGDWRGEIAGSVQDLVHLVNIVRSATQPPERNGCPVLVQCK